jgi:hypothetical protein
MNARSAKFYCSHLIATAYKKAGFSINNGSSRPAYIAPRELQRNSKKLLIVTRNTKEFDVKNFSDIKKHDLVIKKPALMTKVLLSNNSKNEYLPQELKRLGASVADLNVVGDLFNEYFLATKYGFDEKTVADKRTGLMDKILDLNTHSSAVDKQKTIFAINVPILIDEFVKIKTKGDKKSDKFTFEDA